MGTRFSIPWTSLWFKWFYADRRDYIPQDYLIRTEAMCQWNNPEEYGQMGKSNNKQLCFHNKTAHNQKCVDV